MINFCYITLNLQIQKQKRTKPKYFAQVCPFCKNVGQNLVSRPGLFDL